MQKQLRPRSFCGLTTGLKSAIPIKLHYQHPRLKNGELKTEDLIAISMDEAEDLAQEHGLRNKWELAARVATSMLPQIFRVESPVFDISLPPEHQQQLEKLISGLPVDVFTASDTLGWTYQFWHIRRLAQDRTRIEMPRPVHG